MQIYYNSPYTFSSNTKLTIFRETETLKYPCGSRDFLSFSPQKLSQKYTLGSIQSNQNPVLTDWVFWFGGRMDGEIRTHFNAICQWHIASTSANTGRFFYFLPRGKKMQIESTIPHTEQACAKGDADCRVASLLAMTCRTRKNANRIHRPVWPSYHPIKTVF